MKKSVFMGMGTALLAAACTGEDTPSMIELCTQTVHDYAWYLDHPGEDMDATSKEFAGLFTADASLTLANERLEPETFVGSEEIAGRYLQGRDVNRFLHVTSNARVNPTSEMTATGVNYVTLYVHPMGASLNDPRGVTGIAEYRDEYVLEDGRCKISNRVALVRLLSINEVISDPAPYDG